MSANPAVVAELSIAVQFTVVTTLLVYFLLLRGMVRLEEVRVWSAAWFADAVALAAVLSSSVFGAAVLPLRLSLVLYLAGKTAFAVLMVMGARNHLRPGVAPPARPIPLALLVTVWSLGVAAIAPRLAIAQFAQSAMLCVVFAAGGWIVLRTPRSPVSRWLGISFLLLSVASLTYAVALAPALSARTATPSPMRFTSFADAWLELILALSCLAAVADRSEEQLRYANRELLESQERLSLMVDTDPLTGLANRRAMRPFMDRATASGAALIFIDINDFKAVNDRFGHSVGDAVLQRLARLLTETFRPQDAVMRYGGDEFLVIAPSFELARVQPRVERIRELMAEPTDEAPGIRLAAGVTELQPGGDPAAALVRADHLMYHDKQRRG
ncbi:MAG: diguanylate cyclase [Thermoanaerobaculales bacterium]|jgi:diguanylate cyclase (GGDEF)-like protein|nr:diguanylate cyclase [Thermoanaerobaculales bacterium]